jgi:hypothetical protein
MQDTRMQKGGDNMTDHDGPSGPGWRKQSTGDFLTFEVGDVFTGYYVGTTTVNDRIRHIVRDRETGAVKIVREHVQLHRALGDNVREGAELYIHCKGKIPVKNRGTEMFTYDVYIRNPGEGGPQTEAEDTPPPSPEPPASASESDPNPDPDPRPDAFLAHEAQSTSDPESEEEA